MAKSSLEATDCAASVREYAPGDEPGINAVIKSVFDDYGWKWDPLTENKDTQEIEKYYHSQGGGFWVLDLAGEIIGTVAISPKEGPRCTLYRLYLRKAHRGKGYGKRLYHHAIAEAKKRGFTEMEIWSDKELDVSHLMYKASGATTLGDRRVFDPEYGHPYEEWGYLLNLSQ